MLRCVLTSLLFVCCLAMNARGADPVPVSAPVRLAEPRPAPDMKMPVVIPPLPLPKASLLTSSEHLRQAIEHLRKAGLEQEAQQLQVRIDDLYEQSLSELQEKRWQLEQLQCGIAELESRLGISSYFQVQAWIACIDRDRLVTACNNTDSEPATETAPLKQLQKSIQESRNWIVSEEKFFPLMATLQREKVVSVREEPRLIVVSGRPALMRLGKDSTLVVPASATQPGCHCCQSGIQLNALVNSLTANRVRLELSAEVSDMGRELQEIPAGVSHPEARVARFSTNVELGTDETVLIPTCSDSGECWMTAVRVIPVESQMVPTTSAKLEPIPEETILR